MTPLAHILLIDFGSAAPLLPPNVDGSQLILKQYCLVPCGTCDYILPEILLAHEDALLALEMNDEEDDQLPHLTNVFLVYIVCKLQSKQQAVRWKATATKTGPNDARHIVWAISKLFFSFFHVVPILTTTFRYYMWFKKKEWPREGIDD